MIDLPGIAIKDYYLHNSSTKLWIHDHFGPKVEMPIAVYFRDEDSFPLLEQKAMQACVGAVLDIGAGAGAHSLYLQENGVKVTALEISKSSVDVMQEQGVQYILHGDFFKIDLPKYDTLLLLMNGIGICGKIENVPIFLQKAKSLLNENGKILFDSSDVRYMYEDLEMPENYYGEVAYQYSYKKTKTDWFHWLYIDAVTMSQIAHDNGWEMKVLFEDEHNQYLAELRLKD